MVREIDGRGFAFVPREVVAQPKAFGMATGPLEPAHGVDAAGERYRAAMLQHIMAVTVKSELLKAEGIAPTVFVARFQGRGLGADRVRRIFRGETMAQLTDLMFWMTHLPAVAVAVAEYIDAPRTTGVEIPSATPASEAVVPGTPTEVEANGITRAR